MAASPCSQLWVFSRRNSIHLFGCSIHLAFQQTPLETFCPLVVPAIGAIEIFSASASEEPFSSGAYWTLKADRVPGDFEWGPLGLHPSDPEEQIEMKTKRSNNVDLAMIGIAGMVVQELLSSRKLF
jgi:hypothetical protein